MADGVDDATEATPSLTDHQQQWLDNFMLSYKALLKRHEALDKPLGGRLGDKTSLVSVVDEHDLLEEVVLVHWRDSAIYKGQVVSIKNGKMRTLMPKLNPVEVIDVVEVIVRDTGTRGDIRTNKSWRLDPPTEAWRLKSMWEASVHSTPILCFMCEEPSADPAEPNLLKCDCCLLVWHTTCMTDCFGSTTAEMFPTLQPVDFPQRLRRHLCKLCEAALQVACNSFCNTGIYSQQLVPSVLIVTSGLADGR